MAAKPESTVAGLLRQLLAKEITIEQMGAQLEHVTWPKMPTEAKSLSAIEASRDADFEPEGGFSAISQAYTDDQLSLAQYTYLAEASAGLKA